MNVLAIAPHPDDESIGCGGALCLHSRLGDRVDVVFLTSGELGLPEQAQDEAWRVRENEARNAAEILGLGELIFMHYPDGKLEGHVTKAAASLRAVFARIRPGIIYLPHLGEWHPDHQAALPIVRTALAGTAVSPDLRMYEIWTPLTHYDFVENISAVMLKKLRAIRAYRSQVRRLAYDRAITGLNQYRGAIAARSRYAEVYQVSKTPPNPA